MAAKRISSTVEENVLTEEQKMCIKSWQLGEEAMAGHLMAPPACCSLSTENGAGGFLDKPHAELQWSLSTQDLDVLTHVMVAGLWGANVLVARRGKAN